jgi:regulator of sirC expression with transglutaminase-like and TPR domain
MTTAPDRFEQFAANPTEPLDLSLGALLIAQDEYPDLPIEDYRARLNEFSRCIGARLSTNAGVEERLLRLNDFLFDEQGFSGNPDDYYDPRNSFLNDVLDRKLGIPISLSVLYLDVGRRLQLPLEGVSFPGHFLVKLPTVEGDMVLDPYAGGAPLSEEDVLERLEELSGQPSPGRERLPELLLTAGHRDILVRLLRNLKSIYAHRELWQRALTATCRLLTLEPYLPEEVRDRAAFYEKLECVRAAAADYQRYLELNPYAADGPIVRGRLIALERSAQRLN